MCLKCQGWTDDEIRQDRLRTIERHGWSVTSVSGDGTTAAFAYTIGLTRFHGHPELLTAGLPHSTAAQLLNGLAEQIRGGKRYAAGNVLIKPNGHRWQFIPVDDPTQLVDAQETYASEAGLVPGLQVIWSDHDGHWPWQPGWTHGLARQPLYGRPPRDFP